MVDYSSLENYRTERYRGFESLSLRTLNEKPAGFSGLFSFHKTGICRGYSIIMEAVLLNLSMPELTLLYNSIHVQNSFSPVGSTSP